MVERLHENGRLQGHIKDANFRCAVRRVFPDLLPRFEPSKDRDELRFALSRIDTTHHFTPELVNTARKVHSVGYNPTAPFPYDSWEKLKQHMQVGRPEEQPWAQQLRLDFLRIYCS